MAYNYLIELYEKIDHRLEDARKELAEHDRLHQDDVAYHQGRVEMLNEFEEFLKSNYHKMLPKRLREKIEKDGVRGIN